MWLPGFKWVGAVHKVVEVVLEIRHSIKYELSAAKATIDLQVEEIAYRDKLIAMQHALIKRDCAIAHVDQLQELNTKAAAYYGVQKIEL